MSERDPSQPQRSYGCSYGCGNPYDFIIVSVSDGTVEFLCMPCFLRLANDILAAVTDPESGEIRAMLELAPPAGGGQAPGPAGSARGHNAPVGSDDPDLFAAFDTVITEDELPEEFK